jgi:predicted DNA-binding transcriptional regulator AlpA
MTDGPLLIDAKAARAMLSIGERRLWLLTNCNAIPSRRIGRSVRYAPTELRAWIAAGCPTEPGSAERILREVRR